MRRQSAFRGPLADTVGGRRLSLFSAKSTFFSGADLKSRLYPFGGYLPKPVCTGVLDLSRLGLNGSTPLNPLQPGASMFRQPLVRYKPGISRYWRAHRFSFQKLFSLASHRRQKRFTRFIAKLANVVSFSFFKMIEMSLLHLLAVCCLGGLSTSPVARVHDRVYQAQIILNGYRVYNPYTQLYAGDLVFVINYSQTESCAAAETVLCPSKPSMHKIAKHNLHPNAFDFKVRGDTPQYLEVDELTSSFSVLFEPSRWGL